MKGATIKTAREKPSRNKEQMYKSQKERTNPDALVVIMMDTKRAGESSIIKCWTSCQGPDHELHLVNGQTVLFQNKWEAIE